MKRAKAELPGELIREALKMPNTITLDTMEYDRATDTFNLTFEGDALPVSEYSGKGKIPEIIYDPRPTWTVAGMQPKPGRKPNGT